MGLDGVPAGDHQRVGGVDGEDVGQEPAVQVCQVHVAVAALAVVSSGKAASHTSLIGRLVSVRSMGHYSMSRSRFRKSIRSWRCPLARTVRP
ncbi:hypothetical protein AOB60_02050 [Streptomyces noursei]|uniref:Uncharacterized protein n=1 Tax=Streptomyces noursei TaxID=1971 RepID=A0A2N8PFW3_STRNR|nr:hypothetical protein AOB60_02050 [Streptomyces noursei]